MSTPTVLGNTDGMEQVCPVLDGSALTEFGEAAEGAKAFSSAVVKWLDAKEEGARVVWLRACVSLSRGLLQPGAIETLYILTVLGPVRFTQLQQMLGASSRTLSDRLKMLKEAGLVDRTVYDEQPLRVEYAPTAAGRTTASLAAPLMAHLAVEAVKAPERP